jgi:hypothetical protein
MFEVGRIGVWRYNAFRSEGYGVTGGSRHIRASTRQRVSQVFAQG